MISYGKQDINDDDIKAVVDVLSSSYLTQGPKVSEFEEKFAQYVGSKYAVAVSNGTAALHLACLAMSVDKNSTVITTPISFVATANCVLFCNGAVDFVDVDVQSLLDLDKLEKILSASEKGAYQGVIPVQFAGACIDMQRLRSICDTHGLWIIEDACHSPGGYFIDSKGQQQFSGNGHYAEISAFSFHPVKHITAGEGGMLTTNDKNIYQKLINLRTHGIRQAPEQPDESHGGWYYEMHELGYGYRLTDIQCALGISQLTRATNSLERRRLIAEKYDRAFESIGIKILPASIGHAYHLYVILSERRKELYDFLRTKEILAQVHYIPIHYQPYYKNLGWKEGDFPIAEKYYEQCLSLPMYPSLTDQEQDYIIEQLKCFYDEK